MRVVLSGLAVALALVASGPSRAASLTGATITSASWSDGRSTVEWTLPSGWVAELVVIASSAETRPDGSFLTENFVDGGIPEDGQARFVGSIPLSPGTYYARVFSHATDFSDVGWSDSASFTVAPSQPTPPGGAIVTPTPTPQTPPAAVTPTLGTSPAARPASPSTARMRVLDAESLRPVTAVRMGQKLRIQAILSGSATTRAAFVLRGKTCVRTAHSQRCTSLGKLFNVVVAKKLAAGAKLVVFATLDGKVLAKRSLVVKPKK